MFRFTIRDVLWLTVVVAVCLAWWVDRVEFTRSRNAQALELSTARTKAAALVQLLDHLIENELDPGEGITIDTRFYKRVVKARIAAQTPADGGPAETPTTQKASPDEN